MITALKGALAFLTNRLSQALVHLRATPGKIILLSAAVASAAATCLFLSTLAAELPDLKLPVLVTITGVAGGVGGLCWVVAYTITLALKVRREDRRTRANLTAAQAERLAAGERDPSHTHRPTRPSSHL
ncbi:hypothetical protein ETD86_13060 [Nonomuraea turkmeniaca]|uniref:Uncharacterized protein n=1 Tax=Nonomuraea turkmeniaca TaxID=103838 RepID=A0A5S4FN23_9ACTN|nr:hypothetical protein [Nonomuraea turkmeniaca]TMR22092.1 hypothetical protein ETD86_13060 [Nonomuraea turkmeniaca]